MANQSDNTAGITGSDDSRVHAAEPKHAVHRRKSMTDAQEIRINAVVSAAARAGLLHGKSSRISARISPALVRAAKAQTGIQSDTDLIEFALADLALEDKFHESFRASRGTVDPDIKLGY